MYRWAVVFCGLLFHLLCTVQSFGQQLPDSDSSFYAASLRQLYQVYFHQIGPNAALFNGTEYIRNGQKATGFPFFESNDPVRGTVSYNGLLYPDARLQYDLVLDELITNNYQHDALIKLSKEKVDSFSIGEHHFVRLDARNTNGSFTNTGYYEQLTFNEFPVFAKRVKKLIVPNGYEDSKYIQYNTFYLRLRGGFYPVDKKNSLLDLLGDKRDLLKKFIRAHKLNFRKKPEEAIVRTTGYYARLNP
jgi:hypothetical protein